MVKKRRYSIGEVFCSREDWAIWGRWEEGGQEKDDRCVSLQNLREISMNLTTFKLKFKISTPQKP